MKNNKHGIGIETAIHLKTVV